MVRKRQELRRVVVDGKAMVALPIEDYERLAAMRRQVGGQVARLRSVRGALVTTTDLLETLSNVLEQHRTLLRRDAGTDTQRPILDLVEDARAHISQARRIIGEPKPVRDDVPPEPAPDF
jgi:hypothetical protein